MPVVIIDFGAIKAGSTYCQTRLYDRYGVRTRTGSVTCDDQLCVVIFVAEASKWRHICAFIGHGCRILPGRHVPTRIFQAGREYRLHISLVSAAKEALCQ